MRNRSSRAVNEEDRKSVLVGPMGVIPVKVLTKMRMRWPWKLSTVQNLRKENRINTP